MQHHQLVFSEDRSQNWTGVLAMMFQNSFLDSRHGCWQEQLNPDVIAIPEPFLTFIRPNQLIIAEKRARLDREPPLSGIDVVFDGATYWLVNDLELLLAAQQSQQATVWAQVQHGDARQAMLMFIKKAIHIPFYRRRQKPCLVEMLFSDLEWSQMSNQEIALLLDVSAHYVEVRRQEVARRTF
jgi:hypothetical protein